MALRVGVTRDERFLAHKTGHSHPEHPRRLSEIYRMIDGTFAGQVAVFSPQPASVEQVELVHTPSHVKRILKTAEQHITSLAPDTPASAKTYMAAWLAAGANVQGVDMLLNGTCDAFFALVRPPGHHALAGRAGGFCIFNNVAIAARFAAARYGIERILIIDWDIHHGNGLNDLFYSDPGVYYYSTHDPLLYPYSGEISETGSGAGTGYTMNIPIDRDMTDDDMVYLYERTLLPIIAGYRPQLILVAAGFDAHTDDPIGRARFSEAVYGRITQLLVQARHTCAGTSPPPIFFSLEGGYDTRALTRSVRTVIEALLEKPEAVEMTADAPENPAETVTRIIKAVCEQHAPYGVLP
ncbi:MAG: histone deacetylase family protein [Thermodesulfobacteriota bacterium]